MPRVTVTEAVPPGANTLFFCPGCDMHHGIRVAPGAWSWNGDVERPTFAPSVLVSYVLPQGRDRAEIPQDGRCHSFVTNGEIQFLSDCTHALAGKTVPLPDLSHA